MATATESVETIESGIMMPMLNTAVTEASILCCECGTSIPPNAAAMCVSCVRSRVDITSNIQRSSTLQWCRFCDRYLQPPDTWIIAPLESKELLSVCLKKLRSQLLSVRLVDAGFIWTEPHSRRIKVKLTVQKEIMGGAVLQQIVPVEFTVTQLQCDDCRRAEAKDFWRVSVQIRQRCAHRKTLFYLEQMILKHKLHLSTTGIKPMPAGIDFFYSKLQDGRKLVDFIQQTMPSRYGYAQELVTHDPKNNTFDYKHCFSVEVAPVCKDNIVCLSKKFANSCGQIGQFCVCVRISNLIHLIDPRTGQIADVSATQYWREPFESLCDPKQLVEYTVIDSEPIDTPTLPFGHGPVSTKHTIADVWLQRSSELGHSNAREYSARTHLGNLLCAGDQVLALDLDNCNVNNDTLDKIQAEHRPDLIVVKKVYDREQRQRKRVWKLQRLADELADFDENPRDMDDFMEDMEEDPISRGNINVYLDEQRRVATAAAAGESEMDTDQDELPQIALEEMLNELNIVTEEDDQDEDVQDDA